MGSTKAFLKSHCSFFIPIFHLKGCNRKYAQYTRGDIGGKTRKTVVLPGFFKIECGGGSGNVWPCIQGDNKVFIQIECEFVAHWLM